MKYHTNIGVSGEFSVVVRRADGSVKTALPACKNLITDNGLLALMFNQYVTATGEICTNENLIAGCAVGSGSGTPQQTDTALFNLAAYQSETSDTIESFEEPTVKHPDHWRNSATRTFFFRGLNNVNVTEVGLCYAIGNVRAANYALYTHALLKDLQGSPTSVTVLEDETLEVIYTLHQYFDIRQQTGTIAVVTKNAAGEEQSSTEYKYVLQPFGFRTNGVAAYGQTITSYSYPTAYGVSNTDTTLSGWTASSTPLSWPQVQQLIADNTTGYAARQDSGYGQNTKREAFSSTKGVWRNVIERANKSQRIALTVNYGAFNFERGIRAFSFHVSAGDKTKFSVYVALTDPKTGNGIAKTDRERFMFEVSLAAVPFEELA